MQNYSRCREHREESTNRKTSRSAKLPTSRSAKLPGPSEPEHVSPVSDSLPDKLTRAYGIDGTVAQDAFLPFKNLVSKLPAVRKISSQDEHAQYQSQSDFDATKPIHWAMGTLLSTSGAQLTEILFEDLLSKESTKFPSGHLVNPVATTSEAALNANLITHMYSPNANSASLIYAANITGQSSILSVLVPALIRMHRHFSDEDQAKGYSSNMTPKFAVVDLHRGMQSQCSVSKADMSQTAWTSFPNAHTGSSGSFSLRPPSISLSSSKSPHTPEDCNVSGANLSMVRMPSSRNQRLVSSPRVICTPHTPWKAVSQLALPGHLPSRSLPPSTCSSRSYVSGLRYVSPHRQISATSFEA
jgi:hypothetical protein